MASPVVIVRDGDPAALCHPPPRLFRPDYSATYIHASDAGSLPASDHYVFHVDRLGAPLAAIVEGALERQARVTLIIRHVSQTVAGLAARAPINVIPAYGYAEHLGPETMARALKRAYAGARVVADGFIRNSIGPDGQALEGAAPTFVRLIREASITANSGTPVVAGVLALHRSGSKFLRDLIGWTVSCRAKVVHEHKVPESVLAADMPPPTFDQLAAASDPETHDMLRRAAVRRALLDAKVRYLFVTERDPRERLVSYFVRRHTRWLRSAFVPERGSFDQRDEIQAAFNRWLSGQIELQGRWYESALGRQFGVNVLRCDRTRDGLLVGRQGDTTLAVIPSARLNQLRDAVAAEFGPSVNDALADNSTKARGDEGLYSAFRRQVQFPVEMAEQLWTIPELAHIHGVTEEKAQPA